MNGFSLGATLHFKPSNGVQVGRPVDTDGLGKEGTASDRQKWKGIWKIGQQRSRTEMSRSAGSKPGTDTVQGGVLGVHGGRRWFAAKFCFIYRPGKWNRIGSLQSPHVPSLFGIMSSIKMRNHIEHPIGEQTKTCCCLNIIPGSPRCSA